MLTRERGVFTAYFKSRPTPEPTTHRTVLEGPAVVLAEAERPDCMISRVYVTRHTAPALVRELENTLRQEIPVIETSVADLTQLTDRRPHGGVVAVLGRRPPGRRSLTDRAAWFLSRFAIHQSMQPPSRS